MVFFWECGVCIYYLDLAIRFAFFPYIIKLKWFERFIYLASTRIFEYCREDFIDVLDQADPDTNDTDHFGDIL